VDLEFYKGEYESKKYTGKIFFSYSSLLIKMVMPEFHRVIKRKMVLLLGTGLVSKEVKRKITD
jgi:hypothetical protein